MADDNEDFRNENLPDKCLKCDYLQIPEKEIQAKAEAFLKWMQENLKCKDCRPPVTEGESYRTCQFGNWKCQRLDLANACISEFSRVFIDILNANQTPNVKQP